MTTASRPGKNAKDLSPKSPTQVKGGKIAINDNITILRSSKPKAKGKELPPKSPSKVKGGARMPSDDGGE